MTALGRDRMTKERKADLAEFPLKAGETLFRGGLTAINAAGEALRPQTAGATIIVGVAQRSSNEYLPQAGLNPSALPTGIVNAPQGATIPVRRKAQFPFFNSAAADLIATSDWGAVVYAVDDQTVAKTSNGGVRLAAGVCRGVDADGVWVEIA